MFSPLEWMALLDWLAIGVFVLLYFGYPWLRNQLQAYRGGTFREDLYQGLREQVAKNGLTKEGKNLLSSGFVAYVRMFMFFGTVSFFSLGGALGLFLSSERTQELLTYSLFYRVHSITGVRFRWLLFIILSGYAFLQFIWGLKALYHLTHAVHVDDEQTILKYLSHMDIDFTRGIRSLYYLVILFLWFFGPEFLIVGSLILTYMLYRYDFLKTKY
ncbi:MAG: DUF599 family protein [bacterium]